MTTSSTGLKSWLRCYFYFHYFLGQDSHFIINFQHYEITKENFISHLTVNGKIFSGMTTIG